MDWLSNESIVPIDTEVFFAAQRAFFDRDFSGLVALGHSRAQNRAEERAQFVQKLRAVL